MNKIILIEDRPGRQSQFLNQNQIDTLEKKEFLTLPKESDCRSLIEDINLNKISALTNYSLIIIHRSSLVRNGLNSLNGLCNSKGIDLILFSGGLSQLIYAKERYQSLSLNSKDFYNNDLGKFLEKYSADKKTSLLELVYGFKWKLELLMRFRLIRGKLSYEEDDFLKVMLEEEMKEILKIAKISPEEVNLEIDKIIAAL